MLTSVRRTVRVGFRLVSVLGLAALVALTWLLSVDRRVVAWRVVLWGLAPSPFSS